MTNNMRLKQIRYTQEPHCCLDSDKEPTFELRLDDGGDGEYVVLNAHEWAFDGPESVDAIANQIKSLIENARSSHG